MIIKFIQDGLRVVNRIIKRRKDVNKFQAVNGYLSPYPLPEKPICWYSVGVSFLHLRKIRLQADLYKRHIV